jgi:TPR repeat protein/predicted aspartyl protease
VSSLYRHLVAVLFCGVLVWNARADDAPAPFSDDAITNTSLGAPNLSLNMKPASRSRPPSPLPGPIQSHDPAALKQPSASYLAAAQKGSAKDACHLGFCYLHGSDGAPQDDTRAVSWFLRAAGQGDAQAERMMGEINVMGLAGRPIYSAAAYAWFVKAARDGDTRGEFDLAVCLVLGTGCAKDEKTAWPWMVESASEGDGKAAYALSIAYQGDDEFGIPRNLPLAYLWSLLAASSGELPETSADGNNKFQKTAEDSLARSDIAWLKHRYDAIVAYQEKYGLWIVDDGLDEAVTIPPAGVVEKDLSVKVKFGDGTTASFSIDTGSSTCVIPPELAKKLNLPPVGLHAWSGDPPQVCPLVTASGEFDGVKFQNLRFAVKEIPPDMKSVGVGGILGSNFLQFLRLKIDGIQHGVVTVESAGHQSFVVSALLDCGNKGFLIMNQELNLQHPFAGLVTRTADGANEGFYGVSQVKIGRLGALTLGPYRVAQPLLAYSPGDRDEFNVGLNALSKFSATFDYANGKLYLVPGKIGVPEPPLPDWGYGYSLDPAKRGIAVVFPGGPADQAGFKVGDLVVSIDGRARKGISDADHDAVFKPGRHIVVVNRAGQEKTLTLVVPPDI